MAGDLIPEWNMLPGDRLRHPLWDAWKVRLRDKSTAQECQSTGAQYGQALPVWNTAIAMNLLVIVETELFCQLINPHGI